MLLASVIFYINVGPQNTSTYAGARKVTIQHKNGKYRFYKGGEPFFVKGGGGTTYTKELSECGGNTIMCWDTSQLSNILKEADRNKVAVMIGLDLPSDDMTFYDSKKNINDVRDAYIGLVRRYKDDPAVLAWCLGNELSLPFSLAPTPFYKTYNQILDSIHQIDPDHPVSTSIINVSRQRILMLRWRMPSLDFYCLNIYNSIKTIDHLLDIIKWAWKGPYLIGEWAPQGGWEAPLTVWKAPIESSSTKRAALFYDFYTHYMPVKDPRFLGSLAFYWGNRQEFTQSWFSIFSRNGRPTEVAEVLNDCWKDSVTQHVSPRINYMLIDGMEAKDTIIVSQGSQHAALVMVQPSMLADTAQCSWQIFREDWDYPKNPPSANGLFTDSTAQNTNFTAPLKSGPYRVFVTIFNSRGYCATANIPIYVVR